MADQWPQHHSVGFYGVAENWQFEARAYEGQNCEREAQNRRVFGQNFVCLDAGSGTLGSAGYGFWSKKSKRSAPECAENSPATGQKCFESAPPNGLILADGVTKYSLVDIPAESIKELVCILASDKLVDLVR